MSRGLGDVYKRQRYSSRDGWETGTYEERAPRSRSSQPTPIASYSEERPPRTRKVRPPEASSASREATPTDYVEYTPIDYTDNDVDRSTNS